MLVGSFPREALTMQGGVKMSSPQNSFFMAPPLFLRPYFVALFGPSDSFVPEKQKHHPHKANF